ncbi:hypothetical protein ACFUT3_01270 [Streptomyces cinereoruber]|uniref:hypothetical protein n=1 Tax=Streptomyces cinereoruber TaxID=67260 RepID=UPI0036364025
MQAYLLAGLAIVGTMLGTGLGYILQRRQATRQRAWQTTDLRRQETLALVQSTTSSLDQREAMLWQERRSLYVRYVSAVDDWVRVLRDLRDAGGFGGPSGGPIRVSEDARRASPLAGAALDASEAFSKIDLEMTVLAGTPVLSVIDDLRTSLYAAARAALTGDNELPAVSAHRGELVKAMRFELTTSYVGNRHARHVAD